MIRMTTTHFYKDHTIIAAGKRDGITGKYKPTAHISWRAFDGERQSHSFALHMTCDTFEEAATRALKAARGWVDRHVIHVGP
jgi:hypothetical protein